MTAERHTTTLCPPIARSLRCMASFADWAAPGRPCLWRKMNSTMLEIAFLDVGLAPKRDLQDDGLHPRLVHFLDVLNAVALLR